MTRLTVSRGVTQSVTRVIEVFMFGPVGRVVFRPLQQPAGDKPTHSATSTSTSIEDMPARSHPSYPTPIPSHPMPSRPFHPLPHPVPAEPGRPMPIRAQLVQLPWSVSCLSLSGAVSVWSTARVVPGVALPCPLLVIT